MNFKKFKNYLNVLHEFYTINKSAYKNSKNLDFLKRNTELRNKYNGKRIILIFTGNSVDSIDFKSLNNEYVFACNLLKPVDSKGYDEYKYAYLTSKESENRRNIDIILNYLKNY
jgi:hypothetical protein